MSRAGTPTDNVAMKAINGWVKTEMFINFEINERDDVLAFIERYAEFFNEERPECTLGYLTPYAYGQIHYNQDQQVSTKR